MPTTIIESLGLYLPPQTVSTSDVVGGCARKLPTAIFERLTGIRQRRMAGDAEFSIDLAEQAVLECFGNSNYGADDVDLIICCNISRFDAPRQFAFEPCTAVQIRHTFEMRNARCFDLSNACAGIFTGIVVADAFLKTGRAKRVLVVSGEYITHLTRSAQLEIEDMLDTRMACLTLGDSGIALLLEAGHDTKVGFQHLDIYTLGTYSDLCIAKESEAGHGGAIMHTSSARLAEVAIRRASEHIKETLTHCRFQPEWVNYMIPHQTSAASIMVGIQSVNERLQTTAFSLKNTANIVGEYGNTSTTSHFVALVDSIRNGRVRNGDKVLFSITASGITIGTALYCFDHLPDRILGTSPVKNAHFLSNPVKNGKNGYAPSIKKLKICGIGTAANLVGTPKSALKMAEMAARNATSQGKGHWEDIGLLLYAGVYRDEYLIEPAVATILAGALGINADEQRIEQHRTLAFDVVNGALGMLDACSIGIEIARSGKNGQILLCTAEIENNAVKGMDKPLLGLEETASAMLLEPSDEVGFSQFFFWQQPDHIGDYHVRRDWHADGSACLSIQKSLVLDSLYLSCVFNMLQAFEREMGLSLDSFDYVLPPQISDLFIARFMEQAQLPNAKVISALKGRRDLFTSSIPYAFEQLFEQYSPKRGQKALVIGVGSGIQSGCAVYEF